MIVKRSNSVLCPICMQAPKVSFHTFVGCEVAITLWSKVGVSGDLTIPLFSHVRRHICVGGLIIHALFRLPKSSF